MRGAGHHRSWFYRWRVPCEPGYSGDSASDPYCRALGIGAHKRHETDDASAYSKGLLDLKREFSGQLTLCVSIDHFDAIQNEEERGPDTRATMIRGVEIATS